MDVVLVQGPPAKDKIRAIKALRQAIDLSMAEAKRAVDSQPVVIKQNVPVAEGERIKAALEKARATVVLKPA